MSIYETDLRLPLIRKFISDMAHSLLRVFFVAASALCSLETIADNSNILTADSLPASWQMTQQCYQTLPTDDAWWHSFQDPILTELIEKAVKNNYNIASAIKRIDMAEQIIKQAASAYYPTLSASVGWSYSQDSGATEKTVVPSSRNSSFSLGADMNWEIDVFGRVRQNVKAKKAAYHIARADYDAVIISLCADVATAYLQLRTAQRQIQMANEHIEYQQRVVKITEARFDAELGDMLDVTQARIVLYSTQSSLPSLEAKVKTLINSISVLLGESPDQLSEKLIHPMPMPGFVQQISAGVPADILRRRPDIVQAELQLGEYAALLGVAKKDFLPTLSLSGSIGTSAHKAQNLFGAHSLYYSVAPQLSWTIFDGLARNARSAEARLQMEAAIDDYNMTVLNALQEVDNALIQYNTALTTITLQKKVVEQSYKSMVMSVDLYKSGLTAFSNVVDGQMSFLANQNSLVELEGSALTTLVSIYKSLGGGWTIACGK
ncbi:MAG: efflux transporter outer membrane subunit [Muribaculaceae bacterium]|nr:efflux transporter outer membrane subunit [Muribaculaceae bacterium]MDE6753615.1 efflux transporter outer membrane subunit [Muribaculaceae bacterium]